VLVDRTVEAGLGRKQQDHLPPLPPGYFAVPGRLAWLAQPTPCPGLPALELAGIAVDEDEGLHLVVTVHGVVTWLGPSLREVRRVARLIADALLSHGDLGGPAAHRETLLEWLTDAWGVAVAPVRSDVPRRVDEEERWLDAVSRRDTAGAGDWSH
jgi:hypothetical protein